MNQEILNLAKLHGINTQHLSTEQVCQILVRILGLEMQVMSELSSSDQLSKHLQGEDEDEILEDGKWDDSHKIHTVVKDDQDNNQYVKTFTIKDSVYFQEMLDSYVLTEQYFPIKIHYRESPKIIITMPKYGPSLWTYFGLQRHPICELRALLPQIFTILDYLLDNNLHHPDIALRNICLNANYPRETTLHFIDFDGLNRDQPEDLEDFLSEYTYLEDDFKVINAKDIWQIIEERLMKNFNKKFSNRS